MNKKKICMIGPFPPPINGNSKALDTLVNSREFNNELTCYKINLSGETVGQSGKFSMDKVKTIIKALKQLKKIAKDDIDVFYLTCAQSKFGVIRDYLLVARIKKISPTSKIIAHLHGGGLQVFYRQSNKIIKSIIRKTYNKINRVIVLSDTLKKMYDGICSDRKLTVLNNCVDDEFILNESEIENKFDVANISDIITVTYLSNMIPSKGFMHVLNAAKNVLKNYSDIEFYFAGKFPHQEEQEIFSKEIKEPDYNGKVHYLGVVDGNAKRELLKKTDVFVLPTRYPPEGQPISILEAMAAGSVIITTDQGGIADVVTNGMNGYIIRNNFETEISSIISILKNDKEKRILIGKTNYCKVQEKYRETNYVNGLLQIIKSTLIRF